LITDGWLRRGVVLALAHHGPVPPGWRCWLPHWRYAAGAAAKPRICTLITDGWLRRGVVLALAHHGPVPPGWRCWLPHW
ncbi:hypothetical protein C7E18_23500, partial [Stenotrophomonas maltophilia]